MKLPFKRIILLIIAYTLVSSMAAQSAKVNQSKNKAEINKKELKEYVDKIHDKKVKRHMQIQTKEVQKRLKQSSKETDANYNRLNFKAWWSGLFNKNSWRKSKKK
jgi:Ni/Co efflux regulator RcnB